MSTDDRKPPQPPTRYPRAGEGDAAGSSRPTSRPASSAPSRYGRAPTAPAAPAPAPNERRGAPTSSQNRYAHHNDGGEGNDQRPARPAPATRYSQGQQRPQGASRHQGGQRPQVGGARRPPSDKYRQPPVNHKVNNSASGAGIITFFKVIVKLFIGVILFLFAVHFALRLLIPYTPYSIEEKMGNFLASVMAPPSEEHKEIDQYLQGLAEKLAAQMDVPSDMPIHVYYVPDTMPNAFATLGGHIFVTKGLLDVVSSENALSMVLAHEIGHVKNRDPLTTLGSGIVFVLVIAVVGGNSETVADILGGVTFLSFSRDQETKADEEAITAISRVYGHTHGGQEFFEVISELMKEASISSKEPNEFFSTHPNTQGRLDRIRATQTNTSTALVPLPDVVLKFKKPPMSELEKAQERLDKLEQKRKKEEARKKRAERRRNAQK